MLWNWWSTTILITLILSHARVIENELSRLFRWSDFWEYMSRSTRTSIASLKREILLWIRLCSRLLAYYLWRRTRVFSDALVELKSDVDSDLLFIFITNINTIVCFINTSTLAISCHRYDNCIQRESCFCCRMLLSEEYSHHHTVIVFHLWRSQMHWFSE